MDLNWRKLSLYFFLPLATMLVLVAMYFSGIRILESIIAMPYLEGVSNTVKRELGLMENLQVVLILAALFIAWRAAFKTAVLLPRVLFTMIGAVCLFMVLEEIDYGLNYYEFFAGIPPDDAATTRNLHNQGGAHKQMKKVGNIFLVLVFVIAPLALMRVRAKWVRFLTPDPYFLLTVVVSLLISTLAHELVDRGLGVGLKSNISEFRETLTYYIAFLYIYDLSRRKPPEVGRKNPGAMK